MKIEVIQLLSAVCMYSSDGHKLVTNALNCLKVCSIQKVTFFRYLILPIEAYKIQIQLISGRAKNS